MTHISAPIIWNADDYEIGDRFAIPPQEHKVFTVTDRTDRGNLIEFEATLWSAIDEEEWGTFTFTFFNDFPLSARQRLRTLKRPCGVCHSPWEIEVDTAYLNVPAVVCDRH